MWEELMKNIHVYGHSIHVTHQQSAEPEDSLQTSLLITQALGKSILNS